MLSFVLFMLASLGFSLLWALIHWIEKSRGMQ
jgi:hypothetical protein